MRCRISIKGCVRRSVTPSLRRLLGAPYAEYSALFLHCNIFRWPISDHDTDDNDADNDDAYNDGADNNDADSDDIVYWNTPRSSFLEK